MPKLTIITINYNNLSGLRKTIDSVLCQSYTDYEWIIIDGGSVDGSTELIKQNSNSFAYWCSEPDNGVFNAMNKGIILARGEYVQFLNSGDWYCHQDVLTEIFKNNPIDDIVYGNLIYVSSEREWINKVPDTITAEYLLSGKTILHSGGSFIKRTLFSQYGLYDESLNIVADWAFFLRSVALGTASTKYYDIELAYFDTDGISNRQFDQSLLEVDEVKKQLVPGRILSDYDRFHKVEIEKEDLVRSYCSPKRLSKISWPVLIKTLLYKMVKGE